MSEPFGHKPPERMPSPELLPWEEFRGQLVEAGRTDKRPFPDLEHLPKQIELGPLASKVWECLAETRADPSKRERGGVIQFDSHEGKILLPRRARFDIGTEDRIAMTIRQHAIAGGEELITKAIQHPGMRAIFDRMERGEINLETAQREMLEIGKRDFVTRHLGAMHSHPDASPFSPIDLEGFLSDPGSLISLVASDDDSVRLMMKTGATPPWDNDAPRPTWEEDLTEKLHSLPAEQRSIPSQRLIQEGYIIGLATQWQVGYYRGDASGIVKRLASKKKT